MDGFNGMIEADTVALANRADAVTGVSSTVTSTVDVVSSTDTCDDETATPEATIMPVTNVTSVSTDVTTTR